MLLLLLLSFLGLLFFYLWGKLVENILPKIGDGFFFVLLNGIIAVSIIAYFSVFFIPLHTNFEYILIGISLLSLFFHRKRIVKEMRTTTFYRTYTFWLFVVLSALAASIMPYIVDHFSYYVPTIKWLNEVGFVKGIANYEWILVQNSIWNVTEASINHILNPYLRLNLLLLIAFLIYIYENKRWVLLVFVPFFFLFLSSPSTDLPVYVLSLVIVSELMNHKKANPYLQGLFFLSLYIFVIKPVAIGLPLFLFILLFNSTRVGSFKIDYKAIILIFLLMVLFLVKSIWVSANLMHPLSIFSLDFLPWRSPMELYQKSESIGVINSYDAKYTIEEINGFTTTEKFTKWLFVDSYAMYIHFGIIILFILSMSYFSIKKNKFSILLISILFVKCLLIFSQSAQYRFMLEAVLIMGFILMSELKISTMWVKRVSLALGLIALFLLFKPQMIQRYVPSFQLGAFMADYKAKQLIIPQLYSLNVYHKYQIGNLKFNVPYKQPFMFNMELPVLTLGKLIDYYSIGGFPQLYNPNNLKEGFYWKELTSEEMLQLNEIIKSESQPK